MKSIPNKEYVWKVVTTLKNETFYVTSTALRDVYYLYKKDKDEVIRLGKGENPLELEEKYIKENDVLLERLEQMKE